MGNFIGSILDPLNMSGVNDAPKAGTPDPGSVGADYLQLVKGYVSAAPDIFNLQSKYQPQYTALDLQGLDEILNGTNGKDGWLAQFAQNIMPAITGAGTAANTATRTANTGDVAALGAGAAGAVRNINPGVTSLVDQLTKTTGDQLALGTRLDPASTNSITSSVRGSWANRGLGTSDPALLDEALQLNAGGQNLLAAREGAAASAANESANLITNPALALVTGTSNAPQTALAASGAAQNMNSTAGPTLFPSNQSYDMYNTAYNASAASNIANANNQAAMTSSSGSY